MGGSGAGKSTLMAACAGRLGGGARFSGEGYVAYGGNLYSQPGASPQAPAGCVAFAPQQVDALLMAQLTVRETLQYAAQLRARESERAAANADVTCTSLRLDHRLDARACMLSGGERRRLALGIELVGGARVLYADEITSGLAADQALEIAQVMREFARQRLATVVCSIHTPPPAAYLAFDSLCVVHGGATLYQGTPLNVFPKLASDAPKSEAHANDWSQLLFASGSLPKHGDWSQLLFERLRALQPEQVTTLKAQHRAQHASQCAAVPPSKSSSQSVTNPQEPSPLKLLATVCARKWRVTVRDVRLTRVLLVRSVSVGLVLGAIYRGPCNTDTDVRCSMLYFALMFVAFSGVQDMGVKGRRRLFKNTLYQDYFDTVTNFSLEKRLLESLEKARAPFEKLAKVAPKIRLETRTYVLTTTRDRSRVRTSSKRILCQYCVQVWFGERALVLHERALFAEPSKLAYCASTVFANLACPLLFKVGQASLFSLALFLAAGFDFNHQIWELCLVYSAVYLAGSWLVLAVAVPAKTIQQASVAFMLCTYYTCLYSTYVILKSSMSNWARLLTNTSFMRWGLEGVYRSAFTESTTELNSSVDVIEYYGMDGAIVKPIIAIIITLAVFATLQLAALLLIEP